MSHVRQKYTWWTGLVVVGLGLALVPPTFAGSNPLEVFPGDGVDPESPPLAYEIKHRGPIRDLNTGMVWEHKLPEDHEKCEGAQKDRSVHCVNNAYTWSTSGTAPDGKAIPDGTLFTEFLYRLNNFCSKDETKYCDSDGDCEEGKCGYADHRDWRIPNIRELLSIVHYGQYTDDALDSEAAISEEFYPTAVNGHYWSRTVFAPEPWKIWIVNFDDGDVDNTEAVNTTHPFPTPDDEEPQYLFGRAVREGR
jgi:hypothetical protein